MPYLFMLITLAGVVAAQLLLRKGMLLVGHFPQGLNEIIPFFFRAFTNAYVVSAIFSLLLAGLSWMAAISRAEQLSRAYPFMALSYVLVVLFSALVLREHITLVRCIGVVLITSGVFLVTRS